MTFLATAPPPSRSAWRLRLFDLATYHGWQCHLLEAEWGPDLAIVRPPHVLWIFAEPNRGRLSLPRRDHLAALRRCGAWYAVWHPNDAPKIERTLA